MRSVDLDTAVRALFFRVVENYNLLLSPITGVVHYKRVNKRVVEDLDNLSTQAIGWC